MRSVFGPMLLLSTAVLIAAPALAAPKLRITAISVLDDGAVDGAAPVALVDTVQDVCSSDDDGAEYEDFFDSVAVLTLKNSGKSSVRVRKFLYRLSVDGSSYVAARIPPSAGFDVPVGETGSTVTSLFLNASNGRKYFTGSDTAIAEELGLKAVQFILIGRDGSGKRVRARGTISVKFGNYDRCAK